ncbi:MULTISPECIES: DUF736 family protein [unclassified Campylobacter]|uniref:DUF736 family protein n=1 Tax=unclassified Campylobacter TaxID=2593542 RepID=UPI003D33F209
MNIGYFTNRQYTDESSGKTINFIGGSINLPFLNPINVILSPTNDEELKNNTNLPIFKILLYKGKTWQGSQQVIGGVWNNISKDGKHYLRGHIESPVFSGGRLYIALFKPQQESNLLYEVVWSAPIKSQQKQDSGYANTDIGQYYDGGGCPF